MVLRDEEKAGELASMCLPPVPVQRLSEVSFISPVTVSNHSYVKPRENQCSVSWTEKLHALSRMETPR